MINSIKRGVLLSCVAGLAFAGQNALASTADKTYNLTILHTNDNHGRFWPNHNGEYGMAAHYFCLVVISTQAYQNLIYKMQSQTLRA